MHECEEFDNEVIIIDLPIEDTKSSVHASPISNNTDVAPIVEIPIMDESPIVQPIVKSSKRPEKFKGWMARKKESKQLKSVVTRHEKLTQGVSRRLRKRKI